MKLNNIPVKNPERDKAWEAFIKRKDVKEYFKEPEFSFPLQRGYYEMWCLCWHKAWHKGFVAGYETAEKEKNT
jgi:hypothetical protein